MDVEIDILSGTVELRDSAAGPAPAAPPSPPAAAPLLPPAPSMAESERDPAGPGIFSSIPDLILPDLSSAREDVLPPAAATRAPSPVSEYERPYTPAPAPPPPAPEPVRIEVPHPVAFTPPVTKAPAAFPGDLIQEIRTRWEKTRVVDDDVLQTFRLTGSLSSQHEILRECLALLARAPLADAERAAKELSRLTGLPPLWIWAETAKLR